MLKKSKIALAISLILCLSIMFSMASIFASSDSIQRAPAVCSRCTLSAISITTTYGTAYFSGTTQNCYHGMPNNIHKVWVKPMYESWSCNACGNSGSSSSIVFSHIQCV